MNPALCPPQVSSHANAISPSATGPKAPTPEPLNSSPPTTPPSAMALFHTVTSIDSSPDASAQAVCSYLLWPSGRHMPPKLRVFIDFMLERVFPNASLSRTGS